MGNMQKNKLLWGIMLSGGVLSAAALGLTVWNSKQLRTMRRVKQAGRVMNGLGRALCQISDIMGEA